MTQTLKLLITFTAGLAVNAVLTPIIIYLAHRNRWYDERNHRKIHTDDTPRLGGVGVFVATLVAMFVAFILARSGNGLPSALGTSTDLASLILHFLPVVGGMLVVFVLGLVDDFRNLRAVLKLALQLVAAAIVTIGPFRIESITIPFVWYQLELGVFSYPVTILWISAVTNAINFVDGVDGLAGGSAAIAALFFTIIAVSLGHNLTAFLAIGLFGALVGFLIYNMPRAKIFMGDSGSYVIGFWLAMFPLLLSDNSGVSLDLIPAITILLFPITDLTTSVLRRLLRGKHPFSADREHLHHKLIDLGHSTWRILTMVYLAGVILGAIAVTWYLLPTNADMAVILVAWGIGALLVALLTRARHRLDVPPGQIQ
jgi:UDP-GlcNAc:undecaprenyl-phosphate GlcNAc-1-phosphate transferase